MVCMVRVSLGIGSAFGFGFNQSITLLRINDIHKNYYKKVIQYKYTTMWRLNVVSY